MWVVNVQMTAAGFLLYSDIFWPEAMKAYCPVCVCLRRSVPEMQHISSFIHIYIMGASFFLQDKAIILQSHLKLTDNDNVHSNMWMNLMHQSDWMNPAHARCCAFKLWPAGGSMFIPIEKNLYDTNARHKGRQIVVVQHAAHMHGKPARSNIHDNST